MKASGSEGPPDAEHAFRKPGTLIKFAAPSVVASSSVSTSPHLLAHLNFFFRATPLPASNALALRAGEGNSVHQVP